jgi:TolA-binding protein
VDCEKLDALAMELVYDELDARTAEEARLHLLGCTRCAGVVERLRGGLRAAEALPLEPPSSLLEARILAASSAARAPVPWFRRASRAMAVAGTWAMRPQIAMAAVVVLMIGTSAVLLRRSSPTAAQRTRVTDEGTPIATLDQPAEGAPAVVAARPGSPPKLDSLGGLEDGKKKRKAAAESDKDRGEAADDESVALEEKVTAQSGAKGGKEAADGIAAPPSAAASANAVGASAASYDDAMAAYKASRWEDAQRGFDGAASAGVKPSSSLLYAARSLRAQGKCTDALVRFRKVVDGYPGTSDAANAALEGGECARTNGDTSTARSLFEKAKESATTRARAETAIASLDAPKAKAAGPAAATLAPAKPADAKPSITSTATTIAQ